MTALVVFGGSVGHLNGFLKFQEKFLSRDSFNCVFASHKSIRQSTIKINYYKLNSFPAFLDYEFHLTRNAAELVRMFVNDTFLKHRCADLEKCIKVVLPDVIFIDSYCYSDAVIIGSLAKKRVVKSDTKISFYQTRLSTELSFGSLYGAMWRGEYKFVRGKKLLREQWISRLKASMITPGLSKEVRLRAFIERQKLDFRINYNRAGMPSMNEVPELLISRNLSGNPSRQNQIFFGFCLSCGERSQVPLTKPQILVSVGSGTVHQNKGLALFKQRMIEAIVSMPDCKFYLPRGIIDVTGFSHVNEYDWDDYLGLLRIAEIHISHGGINSIRDSLEQELPMIICPLNPKADQIHNALIFERLGLARMCNVHHEEQSLSRLIEATICADLRSSIHEFVEFENQQTFPGSDSFNICDVLERDEVIIDRWLS